MNKKNGLFSVTFQALSLPADSLSDASQALLKDIARAGVRKAVLGGKKGFQAVRATVCGCCLPEGLAVFSLLPGESAALRGFLIPRGDVRAAWHMHREKLPLLAAAGWPFEEDRQLAPEELDRLYAKGQRAVSEAMSKRIHAQIAQSTAPCSFLISPLPQTVFPVRFEVYCTDPQTPYDADDMLRLNDKALMEHCAEHCIARHPGYERIRLVCRPAKAMQNDLHGKLLEQEKQGRITAAQRRTAAEDFAAALAQRPEPYIWALYAGHTILLLDQPINRMLNAGYMDFDMLLQDIQTVLARPNRRPEPVTQKQTASAEKSGDRAAEESGEKPVRRAAPEKKSADPPKKKGGLFGFFKSRQ